MPPVPVASPSIVLCTLNAKYIHASLGLRYLLANMGDLRAQTALCEFTIARKPQELVDEMLALLGPAQPGAVQIIGLGVYIWNVTQSTELLRLLKATRPALKIVLGGPEVSHECDQQAIVQLADHVITGEADLTFARVCGEVLAGQAPAARIIPAEPPGLAELALPYDLYDERDVAHRIIYVEASRGCPFSCEFCLSSLPVPVRAAPLAEFLAAMQRLLERGAKQLKFVDRTFNLNSTTSRAILEFCLAQWRPGRFFHFELVPDRLPAELREVIAKFPPGALQFEVGVQTFNPEVADRISRRQDYAALEENLRWLRSATNVHVHADLIFGLPGETLASFAAGFDRLLALGPQEIQVGLLKRLRGTPIVRHDAEWAVVWNPLPPYEMLQNRLVDFPTLQRLRRLARVWDLVANSGNFVETAPLIWRGAASPFAAFLRWSDWLFAREGRTDSIALPRLMERLFDFLTGELGGDAKAVAEAMLRDFSRAGRRDAPSFLNALLPEQAAALRVRPQANSSAPKRQARRLAGVSEEAKE